MFRGNHAATVDSKGRLKLPTAFLAPLLAQYGPEVFVTSVGGDSVELYPLPVWRQKEERLDERSDLDEAKGRFLFIANAFGQQGELDRQGRIVLSPKLRDRAGTVGRVDVIGKGGYLEAWDQERLAAKLANDPFTSEDRKRLAEAGI